MNTKRLTAMLVLAMILAACGGIGEARPNDPGVRLSQTVTATSVLTGNITVNFPQDWVARAARGEIQLANSQDALETSGDPQRGQIAGTVMAFPLPLLPSQLGIPATSGATQVLQQFVRSLNAQIMERQTAFNEPETFTVRQREAAIAAGTITQQGQSVNAYVAAVDAGEGYVLVLLVAAGGDTRQQLNITRSIAQSVVYEPPT